MNQSKKRVLLQKQLKRSPPNQTSKNAIDFVPADIGKIILRVSKKENKIIFSVEDNDTGIPSDKIDSLFKKFYQIDTTMTRKHGGIGLGLAISRGIVEAHVGEMIYSTD